MPVMCVAQDDAAGGAGLEVDRQLPEQAGGSDASDSDASEPAAGAYVLQRNGTLSRTDTAAAPPWQQGSDHSSSEAEEEDFESERRAPTSCGCCCTF